MHTLIMLETDTLSTCHVPNLTPFTHDANTTHNSKKRRAKLMQCGVHNSAPVPMLQHLTKQRPLFAMKIAWRHANDMLA
jgi:hypothetical protein